MWVLISLHFFYIDYHSRGGYLGVSESLNTPLYEYYEKAANKIGYKTVDYNGEEQIGMIVVSCKDNI